jgi:hypothetical protein
MRVGNGDLLNATLLHTEDSLNGQVLADRDVPTLRSDRAETLSTKTTLATPKALTTYSCPLRGDTVSIHGAEGIGQEGNSRDPPTSRLNQRFHELLRVSATSPVRVLREAMAI